MEQAEFFRARGVGVSAVRVTEQDWQAGAIQILQSLGLRYAAVTAPLKKLAFELVSESSLDSPSRRLESINTLVLKAAGSSCRGTNTDIEGLERAVAIYSKEMTAIRRVAVWGGGGTLEVMGAVFPHAEFYSVRSQKLRDTGVDGVPPDMVIWAASLKHEVDPPAFWRPKIVFDLNYSESSLAREYAVKMNAKYISGLAMFRAQAQAQREFWAEFSSEFWEESQ
jgi:shikimate 5-dehydrogenase